ncbi:PPC domain-containing protein [Horticoccus sp. 23ND18S-11]|uniref:PPC domain-containing protein n=1 Tax=Horticoccus sp. 23ND18S-11 TaxID=3391832 RepID=UPI0039C8F758
MTALADTDRPRRQRLMAGAVGAGARRIGLGLLVAVVGGAAWSARAAAPTLEQFFPVAVQAGTTTTVNAVGKFAPWPAKVWTDSPGLSFRPGEKAGELSVEVGADVPAGPHLVRLYNDTGASAPRFIVVTAEPPGAEVEPNDEFSRPQLIERLPVSLNGRLNKGGDVDSFAVQLEAGQTLLASVDAYVLASPVDAVIRVVDTRGLELALNHDNGRNLDPLLTWTAPAAGTYVVQVFGFAHPATADVRFTGSDACVYRLHLSKGPQVRYTLPLGLERTKTATLRAFGWNLGTENGREFTVDGAVFPADLAQASWRRPEFENAVSIPLGEGTEWLEETWLARPKDAPAPCPPFAVSGMIARIGEVDRFAFAATKGESLVIAVQSAALGFPLDAWLAIQTAAGKERVRGDDSTSADPLVEWTAPESGTFYAVVGSVLQRAGDDHRYRLSVRAARPRFQAVVAEAGVTVEPGKTAKLKLTARRSEGFKTKLTCTVTGLPAGLTVAPVELGETAKEITLELAAAADAAPFSGPVRIHFQADTDPAGAVYPAGHELVTTTLNNGVPQGFRDLVITSTPDVWLTVLSAPKEKEKPADEK